VLFRSSVSESNTFLTTTTWKSLTNEQAPTAMVAIGLVIPLAAGVYDLSIGAMIGLGAIASAWALSKGVSIPVALLFTLGLSALVGVGNGLLVVKGRIESFIATLGVSSILAAMTLWLSGAKQILGLKASYQAIATDQLAGITFPVYYVLGIAAVIWYVLECTPTGRRIYATGGGPEAARLSGVRTGWVIVGGLAVSAFLAGFAGLLVSSSLAAGDPTVGPSYLLPAFAAALLGSTQVRPGRFNVVGTLIAVIVLATGVKGLQLAGAPVWIPNLFNGVALLLAVGLSKYEAGSATRRAIARLRGRMGTQSRFR